MLFLNYFLGHRAEFNPLNSSQQSIRSDQCNNNNGLNENIFTYRPCSTPILMEISNSSSSKRRNLQDTITIKGRYFSTTPSENHVNFFGHHCVVLNSSVDDLICKIDRTLEPPMNTWLEISLEVYGLGKGLIPIKEPYKKSVIFQLSVENAFPKFGSFAGDTSITISGSGFNSADLIVCIGSSKCVIRNYTYDKITCQSPPCANCNDNTRKEVTIYDTLYQDNVACDDQISNTPYEFIFTYNDAVTPEVHSVSPTLIENINVTLNISGSKFGNNSSDIVVLIGDTNCSIITLTNNTILCVIRALEAGNYELIIHRNMCGRALIKPIINITSKWLVHTVSPTAGSIHGETEVVIKGHGFHLDGTDVYFGEEVAKIKSILTSEIVCITPAFSGNQTIILKYNNVQLRSVLFSFVIASTPYIQSLSPLHGFGGTRLTLNGNFYVGNIIVIVGTIKCVDVSANSTLVTCTLANHPAGKQAVKINVEGYGLSNSKMFLYDLSAVNVQPSEGGFGGGSLLTLSGRGFGQQTNISICSSECIIVSKNVTDDTLMCMSPRYINYTSSLADQSCNVTVSQATEQIILPNSYSYLQSKTSVLTSVVPKRGGTGGGVRISISGNRFLTDLNDVEVYIADIKCTVISVNQMLIVCDSGARKGVAIDVDIKVTFRNQGAAISMGAKFSYIDVWSSTFSWGGKSLPAKGILSFTY